MESEEQSQNTELLNSKQETKGNQEQEQEQKQKQKQKEKRKAKKSQKKVPGTKMCRALFRC